MAQLQRTLIILKPDAVRRGIMGEIISRFERAGFSVVGAKMVKPTKEHFYDHYETIGKMISRRGQQPFDWTLALMTSAPVLAMVLEGVATIENVRKLVGLTEPKASLPGTIRGDYCSMSYQYADEAGITIPTVIHASGNEEEAIQEIALWFKEEELFSYKRCGSEYFG